MDENEIDYDDSDDDESILKEIDENIHNWLSFYDVNIRNSFDDKYCVYVDNFTPQQRAELVLHKKPILQMNKLYDAINKVMGEQRQNTAELEVRSLNGEATDEEIKLNQDFLRHVCFNSDSQIAYQTAFGDAVSGGFGAFSLRADYVSPDSFEQSIFIEKEDRPENCFFDQTARESTYADGNFCGKYVSMARKVFEREYPDIPYPVSYPQQNALNTFSWVDKDEIIFVEYYKKEWYDFKLHKLSDGRVVRDDEWKKIESEPEIPPMQAGAMSQDNESNIAMLFQSMGPPKPTIVDTIKQKDCKIMMFKAIRDKIIEKKEFPSKRLPIIFLEGPSQIVDGEKRTISFVRFAKDGQLLLNYTLIDIAHSVQIARKERFMGTPENVAGVEEVWKNIANVQGILPAHPHPVTGAMPIPLPVQELPSSYLALFQQTDAAIQNILGFYEANRGAQSNAKSGIAYKEQQKAGNMAVAVFYDNLNRAIREAGRVVMSMKSIIYDTERKIPIMNQNGKTEHIVINKEAANGLVYNDMTKGSFDVVIDAGPSAAVQKSESLDILVQLCSINPQVFPLVADYIGENLSLDSISGIVKRLKTLVPPDVIAMEEGKPPPQQPPNPQLMMMQQQMQLKQKDQQIQEGKIELEMQKLKNQVANLEKEVQVTEIKAQAEIQKAAIEHNSTMVETTGKIIGSHNDVKRELIKR